MIVKFSDWQGASGMRRAYMLSGVGVDRLCRRLIMLFNFFIEL